jgi:hypothetical protein
MIDTVLIAPSTHDDRRPLMSWLSIVGGWLVALGFAWLFFVLGLAVGFSDFSASDPELTARGVGIGTTIWVVLTWAISLFLGGMFASWMDGRPDRTIGTLHGVAVWGLAMSVMVLLAAVGVNNLLQGGVSLRRGAAAAGAASTAALGANGAQRIGADTPFSHATGALGAQVKRAVAQSNARQAANGSTAPGSSPNSSASAAPVASTIARAATGADTRPNSNAVDRETTSAIAIDLLRGKTDDATVRLAADTGLQTAEAIAVIQSLSPQVEKYKAEIKDAADQAGRYIAAAMWAVFFSCLIALVAAALGGWAGAGHIHRVHDQRTYPKN